LDSFERKKRKYEAAENEAKQNNSVALFIHSIMDEKKNKTNMVL